MSEVIPETWRMALLQDVTTPVSQRGAASGGTDFLYIDLGSLDRESKTIADPKRLSATKAPSRAKQIVKTGDTLFSNVRVYLENVALVPEQLDQQIASTAFCVLRPAEGIVPRYLNYYVRSKPFIFAVNALQRGNSPPSVQDGDVRAQAMPIPPTAEQKRIVSKIDELFSEIEEGERALEKVRTLVERYRQSVLKAAVTGELTRDWREKHKDKLESGEALLARILKARREAWETAELAKMKAKGNLVESAAWKRKYKEPVAADTTGLPALPIGWTWCSVGQLCLGFGNGLSKKPKHAPPGVAILRISAVRPLSVNERDVRYYQAEDGENIEPFYVQRGDLLFTRYNGSAELVGVSGVFEGNEPVLHPDKLIRASVVSMKLIDPHFLALCMNSGESAKHLRGWIKTSAGQHGIAGSDIKTAPVPLPPFDEQLAIVEAYAVAHTRSIVGTESVQREEKRASRFRSALLKAAFTGKLVPQDLTYEPASVLLERIAAERAAASSTKKNPAVRPLRRNKKAKA